MKFMLCLPITDCGAMKALSSCFSSFSEWSAFGRSCFSLWKRLNTSSTSWSVEALISNSPRKETRSCCFEGDSRANPRGVDSSFFPIKASWGKPEEKEGVRGDKGVDGDRQSAPKLIGESDRKPFGVVDLRPANGGDVDSAKRRASTTLSDGRRAKAFTASTIDEKV